MLAKLVAFHDQHWFLFWTLLMALTVLFNLGVIGALNSLLARRGHQRHAFIDTLSRSVRWAWTWVCLNALRDRYPSLNFAVLLGIAVVASLGGIALWNTLVGLADHVLKRTRHRSAQAAGKGR